MTTQKRPFFHKSSLLIGLLLLVPYLVICLPGEVRNECGGLVAGLAYKYNVYEYGWPFSHGYGNRLIGTPPPGITMQAISDDLNQRLRGPPITFSEAYYGYSDHKNLIDTRPRTFWLDPVRWPVPSLGLAYQMQWKGLCLNFLAATILFAFAVAASEIRTRLTGGFFRFGLKQILLVMLLASIICAFALSSHNAAENELRFADTARECPSLTTIRKMDGRPTWLIRLMNYWQPPIGNQRLYFGRIYALGFYSQKDGQGKSQSLISNVSDMAQAINSLTHLETINVWGVDESVIQLLQRMDSTSLRELKLQDYRHYEPIGKENRSIDLSVLNRFDNLESLRIHGKGIEPATSELHMSIEKLSGGYLSNSPKLKCLIVDHISPIDVKTLLMHPSLEILIGKPTFLSTSQKDALSDRFLVSERSGTPPRTGSWDPNAYRID